MGTPSLCLTVQFISYTEIKRDMQLYVCVLLCAGLVAGIPAGLLDDLDDMEPALMEESVGGPSVDEIFAKLGDRLENKFEKLEGLVEMLESRVDEMQGIFIYATSMKDMNKKQLIVIEE